MAHGDGEPDGERDGAGQVSAPVITAGEDGEHQHEGDDQLHAECLPLIHAVGGPGRAQVLKLTVRGDGPEDSRSHEGAGDLPHPVEDGAYQADLAGEEEPGGYGGVQVAAAHAGHRPNQGGYAEPEGQRDLHSIWVLAGGAARHHQHCRGQGLGQHRRPQGLGLEVFQTGLGHFQSVVYGFLDAYETRG